MKIDKNQINAANFAARKKCSVISLDTGGGKTRVILAMLKRHCHNKVVLILVLKSSMAEWVNEFAHNRNLRYETFIPGFAKGIDKNCNSVFLISQHSYRKYVDHFANNPPNILVVDEAKLLKNDTQFYNLTKDIRGKKILLDATPLENNIEEISSLCNWLNIPVDKFNSHLFAGSKTFIRPIKKIRILIELTKKQKATNRLLAAELLSAIRGKKQYWIYRKMNEYLSYLRKFSEGPALGKLEPLADILLKHSQEKGIIFTRYKENVSYLVDWLNKGGFSAAAYTGEKSAGERTDLARRFNESDLGWLVATSAGERAINLPRGTVVVHVDPAWSGGAMEQRKRVHRRTSDRTKTTYVYTLLLRGTADELIMQKVNDKIAMNRALKRGEPVEPDSAAWKEFLVGILRR